MTKLTIAGLVLGIPGALGYMMGSTSPDVVEVRAIGKVDINKDGKVDLYRIDSIDSRCAVLPQAGQINQKPYSLRAGDLVRYSDLEKDTMECPLKAYISVLEK